MVQGYEAWKAWLTFNWDIFLIIVKWRRGRNLTFVKCPSIQKTWRSYLVGKSSTASVGPRTNDYIGLPCLVPYGDLKPLFRCTAGEVGGPPGRGKYRKLLPNSLKMPDNCRVMSVNCLSMTENYKQCQNAPTVRKLSTYLLFPPRITA